MWWSQLVEEIKKLTALISGGKLLVDAVAVTLTPAVQIADSANVTIDPATEGTVSAINGKLPALVGGKVPVTTAPAAASTVGALNFTVDDTEAALSGTNARGFILFNNSSGGQVIYFGDTGLSTSTGFPLRPGDAIDRPTWQDLSVVFALASADGADLRVMPL